MDSVVVVAAAAAAAAVVVVVVVVVVVMAAVVAVTELAAVPASVLLYNCPIWLESGLTAAVV